MAIQTPHNFVESPTFHFGKLSFDEVSLLSPIPFAHLASLYSPQRLPIHNTRRMGRHFTSYFTYGLKYVQYQATAETPDRIMPSTH